MNYAEAVKKLQTMKPRDNYLVVETGYDSKFIFPYKEGMQIMAAFSTAEHLKEPYNEKHRILPLDRNALRTYVMSGQEYERFKIAALLDVTIDELKEMEKTP